MTLTTRLLLFYLSSLFVLLGGFSATLYFLAKAHWQHQSDERLEAALNTLDAAIEITADGVEWEPREHKLRLASGTAQDQLAWAVMDQNGQVIASSEQQESEVLLKEASLRLSQTTQDIKRLYWRGERWQAGQRWVRPSDTASTPSVQKVKDPNEIKYPALIITAALPLEPIRSELRQLLSVLVCVSAGVMIVAAIAGRAVCRRALWPLHLMAADVRAVDSSDSSRRIFIPPAGEELTDLGLAFNGMFERLHLTLELQKRFTGDASHQLRTPLAAILGQVEIALRRERTAEEYRHTLATVQTVGGHLQKMIESLLFLTRLEGEGKTIEFAKLNLCEWLHQHVSIWSNHPRFQDIRISPIEHPIVVECHAIILGEVINILIENACHYSTAGSSITLSLSQMAGEVRLEIADQGQGIAEDDLKQIFTPFFRTSDALRTNKNGVGLGLSIAKRLSEALGGSLKVSSQLNVGTHFTFMKKLSNHFP